MHPGTVHTDRRVNRTRRQLRNALMELILERGYNAVTVEDITERADLGRTTFYLHFHDKEELLIESLEAIAEDLRSQVEQQAAQQMEQGVLHLNPVGIVFRHVAENRSLYRIILKGEGSHNASDRIRDIIEEAAVSFFKHHMLGLMKDPPEVPEGLISGYFATAMLGFLTLWLDKELPYSGDQAADYFMVLFFRGAASMLNLDLSL